MGFVTIAANDAGITRVAFGCERIPGAENVSCSLTTAAAGQILEYFARKRTSFDLPVSLDASEFRLAVWEAVRAIPYGESATAAMIAERIGQPGAQRAVGGAIRANPLALIIPDHRVVTASGRAWGDTASANRRTKLLSFEQHRESHQSTH